MNPCSDYYRYGGWLAFGLGGARLAYATLAKGYSVFASSGSAASLFRSRLRNWFGGGRNLRRPDLTRYRTDAELRAAAGRTNRYYNALGGGVAASGAYNGSGCGCQE